MCILSGGREAGVREAGRAGRAAPGEESEPQERAPAAEEAADRRPGLGGAPRAAEGREPGPPEAISNYLISMSNLYLYIISMSNLYV